MNALIGQPKEALDTPALLIELDVLERNIHRMATVIITEAGVGWRPHTKGMKTPALAHMCLAAGAHGITCAKVAEAEVMAAAGIRDILVANQIVGATKVNRLVNLCRHADVMVCVDAIENAEEIDAAAAAKGVRPRVLIEVNVGPNRAGVPPGDAAVALATQIGRLQNVRFSGLQTWESHALLAKDEEEKKHLVAEALRSFTDTGDAIRDAGIPVDIVSCGGTGTYLMSSFAPGITEIEAGGGIYCDIRYRKIYGVHLEYAMTILTTVTSRPTLQRIICDAGFKATGAGYGDPELLGCGAVEAVRLSAEHGIFTLLEPSPAPRIGEKIEFVPGYSDATVFLHDHLYGIRDGHVETAWPLLGRGKLQ